MVNQSIGSPLPSRDNAQIIRALSEIRNREQNIWAAQDDECLGCHDHRDRRYLFLLSIDYWRRNKLHNLRQQRHDFWLVKPSETAYCKYRIFIDTSAIQMAPFRLSNEILLQGSKTAQFLIRNSLARAVSPPPSVPWFSYFSSSSLPSSISSSPSLSISFSSCFLFLPVLVSVFLPSSPWSTYDSSPYRCIIPRYLRSHVPSARLFLFFLLWFSSFPFTFTRPPPPPSCPHGLGSSVLVPASKSSSPRPLCHLLALCPASSATCPHPFYLSGISICFCV